MHLITRRLKQVFIREAQFLQVKKIVVYFDSSKFLLLTYFSQKRKKILKLYPIDYVKPLSVSTLLNIPALITAEIFTKGKNPVINSVVCCETAAAADLNFLLFLVSTCLNIPRNFK